MNKPKNQDYAQMFAGLSTSRCSVITNNYLIKFLKLKKKK